MTESDRWRVPAQQNIGGQFSPPGDKSLAHRAVILSSLANGTSIIRNFLMAKDCLHTKAALQALGVLITHCPEDPSTLKVQGQGLYGLCPPATELALGNSGTGLRLLAGILAGQKFDSCLNGDASLQQRPMERIITPLTRMGAQLLGTSQGTAPLWIKGKQPLKGIHYRLPVPSAQVKSSLLLAGLYAKGRMVIESPIATRDHTERLLQYFGYPLLQQPGKITLEGGHALHPCEIEVPNDPSSAAFFIVAACIQAQGQLLIKNVTLNPRRIGFIEILKLMGANIKLLPSQNMQVEPVGDIEVVASPLTGIDIPQTYVADAIDEFPALFIAGACAAGTTQLRGAQELRFKESDRLELMGTALQKLGIKLEIWKDGLKIQGQSTWQGGEVDSGHDHRVAMALVVASVRATAPIIVQHTACIATSFPDFLSCAKQLGLTIELD